jgi:hypothetical protein
MAKKQTKKVEEIKPTPAPVPTPTPVVKTKPKNKPKVKPKKVEPVASNLTNEVKLCKDLLTSCLNEMEIKQKNIETLGKIIQEREKNKIEIGDLKNTLEQNSKELSELKEKIKSLVAFIKYYKGILSTKYGPTRVNITFSLIMFAVFGISILTAFGFKDIIGDTSNISLVSVVSLCSSAIGYFLYLVNWKK